MQIKHQNDDMSIHVALGELNNVNEIKLSTIREYFYNHPMNKSPKIVSKLIEIRLNNKVLSSSIPNTIFTISNRITHSKKFDINNYKKNKIIFCENAKGFSIPRIRDRKDRQFMIFSNYFGINMTKHNVIKNIEILRQYEIMYKILNESPLKRYVKEEISKYKEK